MQSLIHFLLPQRSGLFSVPIGFAIQIIMNYVTSTKYKKRAIAVLAGLLMGLLPMISAHTFIAVGEYAIFLCILEFPWRLPKRWIPTVIFWLFFAVPALLIAIPQAIWLMRTPRKDFMKFKPIWWDTSDPRGLTPWRVWWESLGAFAFLAIVTVWPTLDKRQIITYLPSILLFVLSNLFLYQPATMDNNKVFFAAWLPYASAAIGHMTVTALEAHSLLVNICLGVAYIAMVPGSFVTIYQSLVRSVPLWSYPELDLGLYTMRYTLPHSLVLTSSWHTNPIMVVGGRLLYMGYGGWVWSHGLDLWPRVESINNMTRHQEDGLFRENNIRYTLRKPEDRDSRQFDWPEVNNDSQWLKIIDIGSGQYYRLVDPL